MAKRYRTPPRRPMSDLLLHLCSQVVVNSKPKYIKNGSIYMFNHGKQPKKHTDYRSNYFGVDLHHQNYENINISIISKSKAIPREM